MLKAVLGIDVGKLKLDVALMFDKKTLARKFDNSLKGFKLMAGWPSISAYFSCSRLS